jgi:hypothetical protein
MFSSRATDILNSLQIEVGAAVLCLLTDDNGVGNTDLGEKAVKALGVKPTGVDADVGKHLARQRMHLGWCITSAEHVKALAGVVTQQRLSHLAARRVVRADKEDAGFGLGHCAGAPPSRLFAR